MRWLLFVCLFLVTVPIVEYVLVKNDFSYTLSSPLVYIAKTLAQLFYEVGRWWAIISSFINHIVDLIEFQEFFDITYTNLLEPSFKIVTSPIEFVRGYCATIIVFDHPLLVIIGTVVIVIITSILVFKYYFKGEIPQFVKTIIATLNANDNHSSTPHQINVRKISKKALLDQMIE